MKIIRLVVLSWILLSILRAQIVFFPISAENNSAGIANPLEKQVLSSLTNKYYTIETDTEIISQSEAEKEIESYFKDSISEKFNAQSFSVKITTKISDETDSHFNIEMIVANTSTKQLLLELEEQYLSITRLTEIGDYLVEIINNLVPAYSKILSVNELNQLQIDYGWERDAYKGENLELVNLITKSTIGQLKLKSLFASESLCDIEAEFGNVFDPNNLKDYMVRTKGDNKEVDKYLRKIEGASDKDQYLTKKEQKSISDNLVYYDTKTNSRKNEPSFPNNWFNLSFQNFSISDDYFDLYFPDTPFEFSAPASFAVQINLTSSLVRPFFKGRFSFKSKNAIEYGKYPPVLNETVPQSQFVEKSKLTFFQVGFGLAGQISIRDIVYVVPSLSAFYTSFKLENTFLYENDPLNYSLIENLPKKVEFRGLDIELGMSIMGRYSDAAIFIEFGYHILPILKATESKTNFSTSGVSTGFGLTYFF